MKFKIMEGYSQLSMINLSLLQKDTIENTKQPCNTP